MRGALLIFAAMMAAFLIGREDGERHIASMGIRPTAVSVGQVSDSICWMDTGRGPVYWKARQVNDLSYWMCYSSDAPKETASVSEGAMNDINPETEKPKSARLVFATLSEVAMALAMDDRRLDRISGRTLPKGYQWSGHDIPGRGNAAARRLRQQQKKSLVR